MVRGGDEHDVRPQAGRDVRERVAHLPGRAVPDEPDRIERLARAARGDEDRPARQRVRTREQPERGLGDTGGIREATRAGVAAGEPARFGIEHVHTPAAQRREVLLYGGVLPHLGVHCRADEDRRARGEQRGGEEVVGDARRVLAEQLRGCGRNDNEIRALAEARVRNRFGPTEQRGARGLGRERGEGQRADEALGVIGQDGSDVDTGVHQTAAHLDRLVRGDPAADTENDFGHRTPPRQVRGLDRPKFADRSSPTERLPTWLAQADSSGVESTISTDAASSAPTSGSSTRS